jgi:isopenicillin-N epimerase
MWSRRRFMGRVGAGVGVLAVLRPDGVDRVLAASRGVAGLSPQEVAKDEDFWFEVQQAFTVDRNIVNLNNGTLQPNLRVVEDRVRRASEYVAEAGFHTSADLNEELERVRERLAHHAGCDTEEIALVRNGSEAGQIVVMGYDLKPGDEVVTTGQDYPRFITSWKQRVLREGIVLKQAALPAPWVEQDDLYTRLEREITPRTKLIMICSMTHWTAQVAPVKRITEMAHKRGIDVFVDGAHAFMQYPVNVRDLDADYFMAALHKWCMAPPGNGMLYVRKSKIAGLWPLTPSDVKMKDDIRKFEDVGTRTTANRVAIAEGLTFNEGLGLERKAARLRYLKERWALRLKAQPKVHFLTSLKPEESCAIATFTIDGVDHVKLTNKLHDSYGIVVSHMKHATFEGFRVVPNVSNTLREIDYFADAIEDVIKKGQLA